MKPRINISRLRYVDITKHWRKIKLHILTANSEGIWRSNMKDYAIQRAENYKYKIRFRHKDYKTPSDFDSCDWRYCGHVGRRPEYWQWVCHSACHFLVDLNLFVADQSFPKFKWRIVTHDGRNPNDSHSTVWNGDCDSPLLFDMNFLALGVPAKDAWTTAIKGKALPPSDFLNPWRYRFQPWDISCPPKLLGRPKEAKV